MTQIVGIQAAVKLEAPERTANGTTTLSSATIAQLVAADPVFAADLVDPRLVFLERAAARLALIEACALSLDEAFDGLMPAIYEFAGCWCCREIIKHFDREARDRRDDDRRDHRDHNDAANHGPAAASTVDALLFELRTHGIAQLTKPGTQGRIAQLSADQMTDVIAALRRVQSAYPQISDRLVQLLQRVS